MAKRVRATDPDNRIGHDEPENATKALIRRLKEDNDTSSEPTQTDIFGDEVKVDREEDYIRKTFNIKPEVLDRFLKHVNQRKLEGHNSYTQKIALSRAISFYLDVLEDEEARKQFHQYLK